MSFQAQILARFSGTPQSELLYLPDLTLWYDWHARQGTLPEKWAGLSLPALARALGVPLWYPYQPWKVNVVGARVHQTENGDECVIRSETSLGDLVARWVLGPDGDWWQVEYPVKSAADLPAALELVKARAYALDTTDLDQTKAAVGEQGIVALELPRRPYSDLLHDFLGWSEGLMLLGEPIVQEMLDTLESKLQHLLTQIVDLPGTIIFSPDNLDGQYISPRLFDMHLAPSYEHTVSVLKPLDKILIVHVGGPVRHLLRPLADAGVHALEGISGPPQSNASLADARQLAGPELTLWGGIAQDFLQDTHDWDTFESAVRLAAQDARGDTRVILGVADRVPVSAELDRLEAIPALLRTKS